MAQPGVVMCDLGGGRLAVAVAVLPEIHRSPGAVVRARHLARLTDREHRAGRYALRAGLSALGVPAGRLTRRPDGAAQAPPQALVTISHRDGCAVAAAWTPGRRAVEPAAGLRDRAQAGPSEGRFTGLGIDVELVDYLPARALHLLCAPAELDDLRAQPAWLDPTRLFAAKEAVYKAMPLTAQRPFRPGEVALRPVTARTALSVIGETVAYVTTRQVANRWLALCVSARVRRPSDDRGCGTAPIAGGPAALACSGDLRVPEPSGHLLPVSRHLR